MSDKTTSVESPVHLATSEGRYSSWPPTITSIKRTNDDDDKTNKYLNLPEDIYWNYVRPFTPIKERQFVSKRCSTRFPPKKRMSIDDAIMLHANIEQMTDHNNVRSKRKRNGDNHMKVSGRKVWVQYRYDIIEYDVHNSELNFSPRCRTYDFDEYDTDEVEQDLFESRCLLDSHLLNIDSPSLRLFDCLGLFLGYEDQAYPSVLPGDGSIGSMVKHHVAVNPLAVDGRFDHKDAFPPTILGYFVGKWVSWRMDDIGGLYSSGYTIMLENVVLALLENGADAKGFAEPITEENWSKLNLDFYHKYVPLDPNCGTGFSLLYWMKAMAHYNEKEASRFKALQGLFVDGFDREETIFVHDEYVKFFRLLYNLLAANVKNNDLFSSQDLPKLL